MSGSGVEDMGVGANLYGYMGRDGGRRMDETSSGKGVYM